MLVAGLWLCAALAALAAVTVNLWWIVPAALVLALAVLGTWDLVQTRHSILRMFPVLGHVRFLMELIRPEIRQYFIESDTEATPFDRETRDLVYERAKGTKGDEPFGTERDVNAVGYEFLRHSLRARTADDLDPRVRLGAPDCSQPYDIALLNVSAMSFGALSANAIEALNRGAARGGFAHDTGEGGLSPYHLRGGGDLIWEIGSGYFGCRTAEGSFDAARFSEKAALPAVKAISIKLSQGAKPGLGGVLPGPKVSPEIAATRGVPPGRTVVSPPSHSAFHTPIELVRFIATLRQLSGGKPVGFKLCVGARTEFLSICKAMLDTGITPDFIIVDGSEGGTGAAPQEFEDHVGMPLTHGLMLVHNSLVGTGLRDRIRVGASGKVASGVDIVSRICQGADFTMAARAMMFAVGCIQARKCHTNLCPTGVATQDPVRARALDVSDKATRVFNFQRGTVASAAQIVASMGLDGFHQLSPAMLNRRVDGQHTRTYAEIYDWLTPGELLNHPSESWRRDWAEARGDAFA
ncbi:FMN-binding glutamate synthase family protein [Mycobacterium sp. CBMA293]|uniref:FMN-binding glutamate synthase family protein n=1 Tax=unclassified Mycolicibacterium TaxID=2636767 RepID=UPI0012DE23C3|nr:MULTISPECIES: FMN-binding glutamate synthase family protein [unclassified Mycolicibacterium]MUL45136.1 FMN-binding glutamate synthase family protein [Mycolicibacterium sp. CBMA 360]MUL56654.1 FMN-binding glutamate synthase family protein [Mycolicibacterium sp. CBMA 335]MUL69693.1 FMN-binding glutamate synthase family protein [Mycolicibacterium sp. CBMA 311]MUL91741.1 FMN-binding glutamate synthase family protein [Mycolicibacterium sp. CBMA 230]MUM05478.1 FMN-binding glutamate synthase famil